MKVAVVGAGAVGCYFGGLLARAGHDVGFVGRPLHVEAIAQRGLLLETKAFKEYVRAQSATDAAPLVQNADVVLFCVKSADTEEAGRQMASALSPQSVVLSLQNGVDNASRLADVLGRPVVPAVVYVGVEMAGPGHVKHNGRGELIIGTSPSSPKIAEVLQQAGIPTTVSSDIDQVLWTKLITNCAYNALSAVGNIQYGAMMQIDGAKDVIANIISECVAVADRCGVSVPKDTIEKVSALPASMPNQSSSTAQDIARGKPTEIDYLNGYVVKKGREVGVPTPTNLALQVCVKLVERRR